LVGVAIRDLVEPFWGATPKNRLGWQIELYGVDPAVSVTLPPAAWAYDHLYALDPLRFFESETSELAWLNGKKWDVVLALDVWSLVPDERKADLVTLLSKRARRFALVGCPEGEWPVAVVGRQVLRLDSHLLIELSGAEPLGAEPVSADAYSVTAVRESEIV
jgi:hypothetical protein